MLRLVRDILLALIAVAIIGGPTLEFARAAKYEPAMAMGAMAMGGTTSDDQMPASGDMKTKPTVPCKGMTSDCIKLMGCVTINALPAHFVTFAIADHFDSAIRYWAFGSDWTGIHHRPDPFPPRTA